VDKEERRREIALASVAVFGTKGFARTRMEDVAKAAGVGKGTIYEYFQNKEELMTGAFAALFADMAAGLMPEATPERKAADTLRMSMERTIAAAQDIGYAYRFFLEYMLHASRSGKTNDVLSEMLTAYRAWLTSLIEAGIEEGDFRDDIEPYETAAAVAAWFDGAIFHWYTLPDTVSLEKMGSAFLDAVLRGLAVRGKHSL
jgi:AcrR family transcriptional regulator